MRKEFVPGCISIAGVPAPNYYECSPNIEKALIVIGVSDKMSNL